MTTGLSDAVAMIASSGSPHAAAAAAERRHALDQLEVMLRQERTTYRCSDYLAAAKKSCKRRPSLRRRRDQTPQQPVPSLHAQRAALEECARFIGSLTVGDDSFGSGSTAPPAEEASTWAKGLERTLSSGRRSPSSVASPLPSSASPPHPMPSFGLGGTLRRLGSGIHLAAEAPREEDEEPSALERWRAQMVDWSHRAVDAFGFSRQTVAVSFSYVDRYLSARRRDEVTTIAKDDFQLLCMTSLYTAIKICEPNLKLSVEALVDMSRGAFRPEEIEDQELELMRVLRWMLNPPTALCFAERFGGLIAQDDDEAELLQICGDLSEAALLDGRLAACRPSSVALACVAIALEECREDDDCRDVVPSDAVDDLIAILETEAGLQVDNDELMLCVGRLR